MIGSTPEMENSIKNYEHQGMFLLDLMKFLTADERKNLATGLGFWPSDIDSSARSSSQFNSILICRGIISDDTRHENDYTTKKVYKRDAHKLKEVASNLGYTEVVKACNKWMGIDENDGIKHQQPVIQQINNNSNNENKLLLPPERLIDALNRSEYISVFAKIFLKMNETNLNNNNKGWQIFLNYLPNASADIPFDMKNRIYSDKSKNPSEEVVTFIATNTTLTIDKFCEIIQDEKFGLKKYADKLNGIHKKSTELFNKKSSEIYDNKTEIHCWCNKKNLQHLIPIFEKEGIDTLEVVSALNETDLEKMGITKIGDRIKIRKAIESLSAN